MTSAPDTENTHCPRTIAILVVKDMKRIHVYAMWCVRQ